MPAVNRTKKDHLVKLRSKARLSEGIAKKPASTTKNIAERKRQMEEIFSNINAELIKQSRLPHKEVTSGYNIFMDILKVRQIIELDDEEQMQQKQGELKTSQTHEEFPEQMPSKAEREVVVIDKPISHETDSSASADPLSVQLSDDKLSPFISRARFDARSASIDLQMRYELKGLRYFQDIPGQELCVDSDAMSKYEKKLLKVVSFNVLCQRTMDKMPHMYRHLKNNRSSGHWEQRKTNLLIEFDRLDADVFCLQEVQDIHFTQHFHPFFTARGYEALFTPRNGDDMPDGCAIFWRSDRLELIESKCVKYNLGVQGMHKDNVGQVLSFSVVGTKSAICISNTHIYFNMKYGQIKLAQMAYLLCSMHQMERQIRVGLPRSSHFVGHILCGDFNMHPATPLHKFIVERSVDLHQNPTEMARLNAPSFKRQSFPFTLQLPANRMQISSNCTFVDRGDVANLLDPKTATKLTHPFTFSSVYEHWNVLGEPEVSSYHFEAEAPDFIFYSVAEQRDVFGSDSDKHQNNCTTDRPLAYESFIRLVKRLSMPTQAQLNRSCGPLPNAEHGSDHLSLLAHFELLVLSR